MSSQATIAPSDWACAASLSASVVFPELASPRSATLALRGRPPGPRIASRSLKPVRTIRWPGFAAAGTVPGASSGSGAVANAPTTRGAAAPQRAWRDARAADTSGESVAMAKL
jgi:hypothetical protein